METIVSTYHKEKRRKVVQTGPLTFLRIWWPYTMGLPLLVQGMARLRTAATAIDAEVDAEVRQFYEGGRRE